MRNGWVETTLGQYIHINTGKLDVNAASEFGEYPFFTCSRETYRINEAAFEGESVLVAGNGDLNVKYYDGEFNAYQRTYVLNSVDKKILDNRFLFLYMQTYIEYLRSETRGTVIQYLKKGQFTDAKIKLPPLPEQKRIVDLISSVDAYIEALQQQLESAKRSRNAVLHELLTAGGDGWLETSLDGIAEYINGYPFKPADLGEVGLPVIRIKQLLDPNVPVDRTETDTPDRCLLRDGDIVFSWSGTLAVRIWNRGPAKLNQHLFRVVEKKGVYKGIIPLILDHAIEELEEKSHGTTMKHITKQTLLPHKVLLPPLPEQKRIVEIINTVDDVIAHTELTISKGKVLRSGLLSDLLSGEHEILASYDKFMGAA